MEVTLIIDNSKRSETVLKIVNELVTSDIQYTVYNIDTASLKQFKEAKQILYRHGTDVVPFCTLSIDGKVIRAVYMEEIKDLDKYSENLAAKLDYVSKLNENKRIQE